MYAPHHDSRFRGSAMPRRSGSQRFAIVCGPIAIKLPRLSRLRQGMRANRMETRIWREGWQRKYPELCPVLAGLPFGIALIMPAVRTMSPLELQAFRDSGAFPDHDPDPELYESKGGEWGYLHGRPVIVDYAMRVHMEPGEIALIDPRVLTIEDVRRNWESIC
jgi:hypothetical protein